MTGQLKHLIRFTAVLIAIFIFLPSSVLAHNFSVSPAEVNIDNLSSGGETEFELTIYNKDDISHSFILTAYSPGKSQRRSGRDEFPDDGWISFSPQELEVLANSDAKVKVKVAIPPESKWAGKDWEAWLGVSPESSDLLVVKLYVCLLVSTSEAGGGSPNVWLIAGIAIAIILLGYGVYYFRCKAR